MLHTADKKKILVTGGSGFLGRFIASELSKVHEVTFSYATRRTNITRCNAVQINFLHPSTVDNTMQELEPNVVVHAAALADGAECESAHEKANAVNVTGTERLLKTLKNPETLFIYISTDLVFDGKQAPYDESAEPQPLSFYGKTKRLAEQAVQRMWKNHVILRPALMYGPESISGRGSFVQWLDRQFQENETVSLFEDEFRTPVFVKDVVKAVRSMVQRVGAHRIYHIGGPERISRAEFGKRLAILRGYDPAKIHPVKQSDFSTGYPRPADVSLNSARIQTSHAVRLTPIEEGLREVFNLK